MLMILISLFLTANQVGLELEDTGRETCPECSIVFTIVLLLIDLFIFVFVFMCFVSR